MKVLLDSDSLVGVFYKEDPHHTKSLEIYKRILTDKNYKIYLSNYACAEIATVLSHRCGQKVARDFLNNYQSIFYIHSTLEEDNITKTFFKSIEKKRTSFTDCSNVIIYKKYKMDYIFSFDKFYKKHNLNYLK